MAATLVLPEWDATASSPRTIDWVVSLCAFTNATCVVEAGSYRGHLALSLWNAGLYPEFYSADPLDTGWIQQIPGPERRFAYYQGDFEEMLDACQIREVDVAFVDSGVLGEQSVERTMRLRHYKAAQRACKPGGLVITDDTANPWDGVEIVRQEAMWLLPGERGVAVWRKP